MRWEKSEGIFLLEEHCRRIQGSAAYFDFRLDLPALRNALEVAVREADGQEGVLRLTLDRFGAWSLEFRPLPGPSQCRVSLALSPVDAADPFLFHKTTRRALYEQAKSQAPGVDDVLLWNARGEMTESTIANLVEKRIEVSPVDTQARHWQRIEQVVNYRREYQHYTLGFALGAVDRRFACSGAGVVDLAIDAVRAGATRGRVRDSC